MYRELLHEGHFRTLLLCPYRGHSLHYSTIQGHIVVFFVKEGSTIQRFVIKWFYSIYVYTSKSKYCMCMYHMDEETSQLIPRMEFGAIHVVYELSLNCG